MAYQGLCIDFWDFLWTKFKLFYTPSIISSRGLGATRSSLSQQGSNFFTPILSISHLSSTWGQIPAKKQLKRIWVLSGLQLNRSIPSWQGRGCRRKGIRNRKPSSHITSVVRKQRIGCGVSCRRSVISSSEAVHPDGSKAFQSWRPIVHIQTTVPSLLTFCLCPKWL